MYGSAALDTKRRIALGDPRFLPSYIPQSEAGNIAAPGAGTPGDGFRTPEPVTDEDEKEEEEKEGQGGSGSGRSRDFGQDATEEDWSSANLPGEVSWEEFKTTGMDQLKSLDPYTRIADFVSNLVNGEDESIDGNDLPA